MSVRTAHAFTDRSGLDPAHSEAALAKGKWTTFGTLALYALAVIPVLFVLACAVGASRNIVYWDEFDTVLAFILRLDDGVTPLEFLRELFAINNEHRMVTSRLLTALSFWVIGTADFHLLSVIGNGSLVALAVLLVREAGTTIRRARLALLLGFGVFHLAQFENLFWPGASIDHLVIVLLAAVALIGVSRGSLRGLTVGVAFAGLATFTLAHGILTWPIGAVMLWREKRHRHLFAWCAAAGLVGVAFAIGFEFNTGDSFTHPTPAGLLAIALYWLRLIGAAMAFGHSGAAVAGGIALLGLVVWAARTGALRRERTLFPLSWFGLGSMALIALGRAQSSGGVVHSRYMVLSALVWAVTVFILIERYSHPWRPWRLLRIAVPLLIGYNVAVNVASADEADAWIECRDRAAVRYIEHGEDGEGAFKLHPLPAYSTELLDEAERRGLYRMPAVCRTRHFPDAKPSDRIAYFVDEMHINEHALSLSGWAAIPGERAVRGSLHIVLRSAHKTHLYTTVTVSRPDVVQPNGQPGWILSGFRFARARDRLPAGEYQIGFLIARGGAAEYIMTAHRVNLDGKGWAKLATAD